MHAKGVETSDLGNQSLKRGSYRETRLSAFCSDVAVLAVFAWGSVCMVAATKRALRNYRDSGAPAATSTTNSPLSERPLIA
jgi:hypothetical protein